MKVKLWSFTDLLGLRFIYWLRRKKVADRDREIPATSMPAIREALQQLRQLDLHLFEEGNPTLLVSMNGQLYLNPPSEGPRDLQGQLASGELLDLIAPFQTMEGSRGPNLITPGVFVRIIPRKLSGAPHIINTRVETQALHALELRGFAPDRISALYPSIEPLAIDDALQVERNLAENLRRAA